MKSWAIVPAIFMSATVWSQNCFSPLEKSAPDERFQLDAADNGIVTDIRTGLTWQRCAVGFELDNANTSQFEDDACQLIDQNPQDNIADNEDGDDTNDVETIYSWYEALEYAELVGNGWRVPNIKELASLVETACFSPAINSDVFPNAVQINVWSSTIDAVTDSSAWTMGFSVGNDSSTTKNANGALYLVRD